MKLIYPLIIRPKASSGLSFQIWVESESEARAAYATFANHPTATVSFDPNDVRMCYSNAIDAVFAINDGLLK